MNSDTDINENVETTGKVPSKKHFEQLKQNQFQLKQRVRTLKNYDTWRTTKLLRISNDQMKKIEEEPLLSIAFSCGYKNDANQILEDLFRQKNHQKSSIKHQQDNKFSDELFQKATNGCKKKLSFVQYKNTKQQLKKITRSINPSTLRKRARTEQHSSSPKKTIELGKTPRQIKHLRNAMKTLPILSQKDRQERNQSKYSKQFVQQRFNLTNGFTKDTTQMDNLYEKVSPQNRRKTNRKINPFKERISEILTTADQLLQQQLLNNRRKDMSVQIKPKSAEKSYPSVRYWPQYKHYSISTKDKTKMNEVKSNYKEVFEDGFEFQDYILQIVRNLKKDFHQIEEKDKIRMVQALKNAVQLKFKYKMSIQRENYKRNVKSYLKCIQEHRNETKRQEVKANGIRRFKRQTLMQKIKTLVPQKPEDQEI